MPAHVGPSDAARYGWPGVPEPVLVADATRIARQIARAHPPVVALFPVDDGRHVRSVLCVEAPGADAVAVRPNADGAVDVACRDANVVDVSEDYCILLK